MWLWGQEGVTDSSERVVRTASVQNVTERAKSWGFLSDSLWGKSPSSVAIQSPPTRNDGSLADDEFGLAGFCGHQKVCHSSPCVPVYPQLRLPKSSQFVQISQQLAPKNGLHRRCQNCLREAVRLKSGNAEPPRTLFDNTASNVETVQMKWTIEFTKRNVSLFPRRNNTHISYYTHII